MNLTQKENHFTKYGDSISRSYLTEIREKYNWWHNENILLLGPYSLPTENDFALVSKRVQLLEDYKTFIDQQKYAEQFDSRSNLHSSVLEEFLFYLFRDLVTDFGSNVLIGKSHTFKDIFFAASSYREMTRLANARIEQKDHDFVIGVTVEARLKVKDRESRESQYEPRIGELKLKYETQVEDKSEIHLFDIPAVVIECKTYLDKTMLEGSSRAAEQLKAKSPNALYIVVMEWLKLTSAVNIRKYDLDQIYVFRKQKNTDREFRFLPNYVKKPIDATVVWHLYETVRSHLTTDWERTIERRLEDGYLL